VTDQLSDHLLLCSHDLLTEQEAEYMERTWRAKTIGPTLPSFYLDDGRLPSNKTYGVSFFSSSALTMEWLDKQLTCSVVLASYGTVYRLQGRAQDFRFGYSEFPKDKFLA
jgi:hypothetical protein